MIEDCHVCGETKHKRLNVCINTDCQAFVDVCDGCNNALAVHRSRNLADVCDDCMRQADIDAGRVPSV